MHNVQDQHDVIFFDPMNDDIVISREAAQTGTQIVITPPAKVRMPGK